MYHAYNVLRVRTTLYTCYRGIRTRIILCTYITIHVRSRPADVYDNIQYDLIDFAIVRIRLMVRFFGMFGPPGWRPPRSRPKMYAPTSGRRLLLAAAVALVDHVVLSFVSSSSVIDKINFIIIIVIIAMF